MGKKRAKRAKAERPSPEAAAERVRALISSPSRPVISIDQALDGIGVAVCIPRASPEMALAILEELARLDPRHEEAAAQIQSSVRYALSAPGWSPLSVTPAEKRRKPFSFGIVPALHGDDAPKLGSAMAETARPLIVHCLLAVETTDAPEWRQCRRTARNLAASVARLARLVAAESGQEPVVTLEGLAMHGNKHSIAILPCLGIVWAYLWEELENAGIDGGWVMPISTWKKAFGGHGKLKKEDVIRILNVAGFARFASDDEADAVAMAVVASSPGYEGQETSGRIRPLQSDLAARREERRAKAERKALKAESALADPRAGDTTYVGGPAMVFKRAT